MPTHDIITIGGSAGGIEALKVLVSGLPAELPASVFVVVHLPRESPSTLPHILSRSSPLPAMHAVDGEPIQPGRIFVAPPDRHLIVSPGRVQLGRGPLENRCRPAVDPLFRSAARSYGPRAVGVVLSGNLDDGTAGLSAIKECGGMAVVQDPEEAQCIGMPRSAIANVAVDEVLAARDIGPLLGRLAREPAGPMPPNCPSPQVEKETAMAAERDESVVRDGPVGPPSGFGCPECGGALFRADQGSFVRFRCRVGHAYSPQTLLADQGESIEEALWTALRALEEKAAFTKMLVERSLKKGYSGLPERFRRQSEEAEASAAVVRRLLNSGSHATGAAEAGASALAEGEAGEADRPGDGR